MPDARASIARWAAFQARHPLLIVLVAVAASLAAGGLGASVVSHLRSGPTDFQTPGSASVRVRNLLAQATGIDPQANLVVLVSTPAGAGSQQARDRVARTAALLRSDPGIGRIEPGLARGARGLVSRDGRLVAVLAGFRDGDAATEKATVSRLLTATAELPYLRLGGTGPVDREIDEAVSRDIFRAEVFALPLLFLCLCFVFRGLVAAAIPVLLGMLSVFGSLLGLRLGAEIAPVSSFALNLVTGLGLGLAIDYSLLVVTRFRDERRGGLSPPQALDRTLATAGRTVAFSALTVAGALTVLVTFPQSFVYSMGIGGVCVALLSGFLALAVLPALLILVDPWLDRFRIGPARDPERAARRWGAVARGVTGRPVTAVALAVLALLAMALPLLQARFTFGDDRVLPAGAPARVATESLVDRFPRGAQEPVQVVLSGGEEGRLSGAAVSSYAAEARRLPDVAAVEPPLPISRHAVLLTVRPRERGKDPRTLHLVDDLRGLPTSLAVAIGGEAASLTDLHRSLEEHLPLALALVAIWLFLLVRRLTGSAAVALSTLAMSALSLTASLGLLVLAFQNGWLAAPLGFSSEGAIGSAEPIVLLFLVLALTSDYATFLLARIHEARRLGPREAVVTGVARTGSVVTSAALLFAIALGAFVTSGNVYVKQLGFGATVAVLLDATLVRGLLLPAAMVLLGRRQQMTRHSPATKRHA